MLRILCYCLLCLSLFAEESVNLQAPCLLREHIIGTNVGVRPLRKSGIRLEAVALEGKWIIHNYGYGGSGLTLCFGGAQEVINLLSKQGTSHKIAVLGAGVIGLATAYDLLDQGYDVTIYAAAWSPCLTSNVAAGIWTPLHLPMNASKEQQDLYARLHQVSEQRLLKSIGDQPEFAGVHLVPAYTFNAKGAHQSRYARSSREEEVIVCFDHGFVQKARRSYAPSMEGSLFVEDLYAKVQAKGATCISRHFTSLDDVLALEESVIINCTSLGSRELFGDQEMVPVRGHLVYFKPQETFDVFLCQAVPAHYQSFLSDDSRAFFMVYPWSDRLILGGTYEYGQEELTVDPDVIEQILKNAERFLAGEL